MERQKCGALQISKFSCCTQVQQSTSPSSHLLNETLNCDPVLYDLNVGGTVKSIPILTLARLQHGYQTIKGTLPQCV